MPRRILRFLHGDRGAALAVFAVALATYAVTMCRTIYSGDDGDFITAAATAGVPHPTGYPLFVMLGRVFLVLVPFGNPAFRMNLMTALFGAAAVALFYLFAARIVPERFFAATAALVLAFTPTFWQQSLSCEVYSLTCLFLAALLYLAVLWREQPNNDRLLTLLAFVYGLACTNHLTIVLFLPGFLVFVFATRRTLWREGRMLLRLVAAFLVPLLFYAYLPLAARGNPPVAWGDPSTPGAFWAHITGQQFHHLLRFSPPEAERGLLRTAALFYQEFGPWFLWPVPVGALCLWRRDRALCLLLVYIWVADVAYAVNYRIFDIYVYYLPATIVTAAFLAAGVSAVHRWMYDRLRLSAERRAYYAPLVAVVALAVPLIPHALHLRTISKSDNYLEEDFSGNLLGAAPPNALVITNEQWAMTLWYRRFVLDQRRDVVPVARGLVAGLAFGNAWYYRHLARLYPDIARTYAPNVPEYSRRFPQQFTRDTEDDTFLLAMIERAVKQGVPVLIALLEPPAELQSPEDRSFFARLDARFDRVPWGVADRVFLKGQAPPSPAILRANVQLWSHFQTRGLFEGKAAADPMQAFLPYRYAMSLLQLGKHAEKARRYDLAMNAYARSNQLYEQPEAVAGLARSAKALADSRRSLSK